MRRLCRKPIGILKHQNNYEQLNLSNKTRKFGNKNYFLKMLNAKSLYNYNFNIF